MHNNFFIGVKFETSWGVEPKISKNTLLERVFEKMVSYLSVIEGIFEAKGGGGGGGGGSRVNMREWGCLSQSTRSLYVDIAHLFLVHLHT